MIQGYLKLALRVLKRSPFFTAISLFGISFTLAGLMLTVAYLQNQFGNNTPLEKSDNLVYLMQLEQRKYETQTSWILDSTLVNGAWKLDSTAVNSENSSWMTKSNFSLDFLHEFVNTDKLTTAENITYLDCYSSYDLFLNNRKLKAEARHVDEHYFDLFNFEFAEGRALNDDDIRQGALNVVISEEIALQYFGKTTGIIGQYMHIDHKDFEVKGVVNKAQVNNEYVNGDLFLPITYLDPSRDKNGYFGMFCAVVESKNGNTEATLRELENLATRIPFLDPSETNGVDFNYLRFFAANHRQFNSIDFFYSDDPAESYRDFIWAVALMITLFCAVPLTNLINLNVSRVIDRSAEIGVRKAFGANNQNILIQIVTENIVLTFIGGLIGLIITAVLMHFINTYEWMGELHLGINFTVFTVSILVTLIFGILSGYLPALKMARSSIVESIKYK